MDLIPILISPSPSSSFPVVTIFPKHSRRWASTFPARLQDQRRRPTTPPPHHVHDRCCLAGGRSPHRRPPSLLRATQVVAHVEEASYRAVRPELPAALVDHHRCATSAGTSMKLISIEQETEKGRNNSVDLQ